MSLNWYFRLSSLAIPPVGFLLNFTLFWLILRRTPKEMWLHSRVLLQTCILDLLLLVVFMFGMVYGTLLEYKAFFIFDGYLLGSYFKLMDLNNLNNKMNLFICWHSLFNFDVFGVAIQFLYRYLLLTRNIKITFSRYLSLLIFPLIVAICSGWFSGQSMAISTNESVENGNHIPVEKLSNLNIDFNQTSIYFGWFQFDPFLMPLAMCICILFYTISYIIIIFCGYKMVKFVATNAMHQNLKALNKQLSKSLIILASYPFILQATMLILFLNFAFPSFANATLLLTSLIHWLPILNPLASLWTFRPYRDALIGPFKKARIFQQQINIA